MKQFTVILFLFIGIFSAKSQIMRGTSYDHWAVSLGINFVDNDGRRFKSPFKTKDWNTDLPIMFGVERKWSELFGTELAISLNKISASNQQDYLTIDQDYVYFALDINGKFFFDHLIYESPFNNWFESYVILGVGAPFFENDSNVTLNTGLGFNFWFDKQFGVRIQTVGKFAADTQPINSNHIQHSLTFLYLWY
ncbi:hypothetical protein [Mangrovimonas sp. YM274]|uniref:hypothetical protein n=1 Tax=Mangrovimonas sp. YM274 TaxID=3070660 RepID=UPI0027DE8232|nr:hypothetical protein [Mangrovimonas sp. YM274]WMI68432.1 hypothetical protein RBH95_14935 [Mangrovimonas sp. YM274]